MKMIVRGAVGASIVGVALGSSLIACTKYVPNSGTICFNGVNTDRFCNPSTFTEYNSCGEKYCCAPASYPVPCMDYVNENHIQCNNGVEDRECKVGGSGSNKCSQDYCCKDYVRVISDCWQWTSGGSECPWGSRKNGWQGILKNYACFEKVNLDAQQATAAQNGVGPCSLDQCCAMIVEEPQPEPNGCEAYPPHVPAPEKNYDWRCDCFLAAKDITCSSGKLPQTGKLCTRYSKKYPGVPKCTASNCCARTPWVYSGETKPSNPPPTTPVNTPPPPPPSGGGESAGGFAEGSSSASAS